MKKSDIFWQSYINLENSVIDISKYIAFTDEVSINSKTGIATQACDRQLEVFSPYIADLLVCCCIQIEALSKELYFDNDGKKNRHDDDILFDVDCLKLIDIKWRTHAKTVVVVGSFCNFVKAENRFLRPLNNAHKKKGTDWERAYQAVKHDRFTSLHKGTIKVLIHALAALYLLNIYYRDDSWIVSYQDIAKLDYSMGSKMFAVNSPVVDTPWYDNTPIDSDSPFVANYKEEYFNKIRNMQQKEDKELNHFYEMQPEVSEAAFQIQLKNAYSKVQAGSSQKVIPIIELAQYRLNKKISQAPNFATKKELLLNSDEWKGRIYQKNPRWNAEDISEDNIQNVIDSVGYWWGMEMILKIQKCEWLPLALNNKICKIYIPS